VEGERRLRRRRVRGDAVRRPAADDAQALHHARRLLLARLDPLPARRGEPHDATYYASGWLLVRWALDHYAGDEESFVRALTTETGVFGLSNLARRAGRPAVEMLADWSLAMAADDRAGFTPRRAQLAIPSWNTRDVFQRLNATDPIGFRRQFPLTVQQVPWGAFTLDVPTLRAWSAAFFELGGAAGAGPQLVELRGGAGSALSPQTGMAIVRVE
jgi:hypothetical protein